MLYLLARTDSFHEMGASFTDKQNDGKEKKCLFPHSILTVGKYRSYFNTKTLQTDQHYTAHSYVR